MELLLVENGGFYLFDFLFGEAAGGESIQQYRIGEVDLPCVGPVGAEGVGGVEKAVQFRLDPQRPHGAADGEFRKDRLSRRLRQIRVDLLLGYVGEAVSGQPLRIQMDVAAIPVIVRWKDEVVVFDFCVHGKNPFRLCVGDDGSGGGVDDGSRFACHGEGGSAAYNDKRPAGTDGR